MSKASEATALQRKIFSRWVNQKIAVKGKKITDVVNDFKDGDKLIILLETLSEIEFKNWKKIQTGSRMKQIDACGQAIAFLTECGVEMKAKPSPENLVDGLEVQVLGLVWAIMLKFMKLDDGEENGPQTTFADALRMWIGNQIKDYGLAVDNWTKSFHDGKVFCALVHKFRPKLLNYDLAKNGTPEANLKMVFAAAESYFGLEQYLSVADIAKLDDKSMVVYASEYYYGIAQQRKVDLAAKRLAKLVDYTRENDRLKEDYTTRATTLMERLKRTLPVLGDTVIENTMAGAVRRLGLFNEYQKKEKPYLASELFACDCNLSDLARRLMTGKRPAYTPKPGCSIPELSAGLKEVETLEARQNVALHEELNRQIRLAKLFEQFTGRSKVVNEWIATQRAYLDKKLTILSVGEANFALNQLQGYFTAFKAVHAANIPTMDGWQKDLDKNKFEHIKTADANMAEIHAGLKELETKSALKQRVHEDDLARETLKAKVRGWNDDHVAAAAKLDKFLGAAKAALSKKEVVQSIKDAELHLGLTRALHQERADLTVNVAPLKKIGQDVITTEYKSEFSAWKFEHPAEVSGREAAIDRDFAQCESLGTEKLKVLEDDLEREKFRETVRQWNENHKLQFKALNVWLAKSNTYVAKKEPVDSVENAQDNLLVHKAYLVKEKAMQDNDVAALQRQGKEILDAKYETQYSKYTFSPREEVTGREQEILGAFAKLCPASAHKLEILEDDLPREEFRFKVNKWNEQHIRQHGGLDKWIAKSKAYVDTKEPVDSVEQAQDNLVVHRDYLDSQRIMIEGEVHAFKVLGKSILDAVYQTKHSRWTFKTPEEVKTREDFVNSSFDYLTKTSTHKLAVLEDDFAREEFRFKVNKWNEKHVRQFKELEIWIAASKAYVDTKEPVDSVEQAQDNLAILRAYLESQKLKEEGEVAALRKLGHEILTAKYQTTYSTWTFKTPEEVKSRESTVGGAFEYLHKTSAHKNAILDDDLAREQFRYKVNKWSEQHARQHNDLETWIGESKTYVAAKEPVNSVEQAQDNLITIRAYLDNQKLLKEGDVKSLQALGVQILTAKYKSAFSEWQYKTPEDIHKREKSVTSSFEFLEGASAHKKAILDDDLGREQFKFKLRLWDSQHQDSHKKLQAWVDIQKAYLAKVDAFDSILDAEKNLKTHANYEQDKGDMTKITVAAFNKLAKEILDAKYETKYSDWKWDKPDEVQKRLAYVTTSWAELDAASAAKKKVLDENLVVEKRKEALRVQWAKVTDEASSVIRDTCVSAPTTMFGQVLEEVESFGATLEGMDSAVRVQIRGFKKQGQAVWAEMLQLKIRTAENPYSKLTPEDMVKHQAELEAALAARKQRYQAELEKQRADDKACRDLAAAADSFVKLTAGNTAKISESKETIEKQLELVNSLAGTPTKDQVEHIVALQKIVDDRKIIYNRHTLNNAGDCQTQFTQYQGYISSKRQMLEADIEYKALRGVPKETYVEMKAQFEQFDKDKSGFLDKFEFRACLYSMGDERGKKEVDAILKRLGNGDENKVKISYDGFKEFMISQLGDTDTEDAMIRGLKLMNRQEDKCNWKVMADLLDPRYCDYIKATHGDNYAAWVSSVFSR